MTKDELKQDISRKWRLISDRLIGQYTYSAKSMKYIIKDIRKPNFKRVGYYPIYEHSPEKPSVEIKLDRPLNNIPIDHFFEFEFKIDDNYEIDPHEITIDLSKPYGTVNPHRLIDTLFKDRHDDPSGNFESTTSSLDTLKNQLTAHGDTFIYELLQNANDYPVTGEKVDVEFRITDDYLLFMHTGRVFDERNISGICGINEKEKAANKKTIGYKGIGFKTVFHDSNFVYIETGDYHFRFDEEAKQITAQNAPWAILPVWTEKEELDPQISEVFDNADPKFRVKIALRPKDRNILSIKEGYADAMSRLFKDQKIILFIPEIESVTFYDHDRKVCGCSKLEKGWIVSESFTTNVKDIDPHFCDYVNEYIKGGGEIPEKFKDLQTVQTQFACQYDEKTKKIQYLDNAKLYCYLPVDDARWGFKFLMNTDMIPDGPRNEIQMGIKLANGMDFNIVLTKIAGKCFYKWIEKLVRKSDNGSIDIDSIFGLIPDFEVCKDRNAKYRDYISAFQEGFENALKSDNAKLIKTEKGYKCINEVLFDETRLTDDGVIKDTDFFAFVENITGDEMPLPDKSFRESINFHIFFSRYAAWEQKFTNEDLHDRLCTNEKFKKWLSKDENDNHFLCHLLNYSHLKEYKDRSVFKSSNGKMQEAKDLYFDLDKYYDDIKCFGKFLTHLDSQVKKALQENKKWDDSLNLIFKPFSEIAFLSTILGDYDSTKILAIEANSYHFFHFLSTANVYAKGVNNLPLINDERKVVENWNETIFFPNNDLSNLIGEGWIDKNTFAILNYDYFSTDAEKVKKYLIENLSVLSFNEEVFTKKIVLEGKCIKSSSEGFNKNLSFVKFIRRNESLITEKTLCNYKLYGIDKEGNSTCQTANDIYEDNVLLCSFMKELWLPDNIIYKLDSTYDKEGIATSFLKEKFGVKTINSLPEEAVIIRDNLKQIISYLDSSEKIIAFYNFLSAHTEILTEVKKSVDFAELPYIDENGNICKTEDEGVVYYIHSTTACETIDGREWLPSNIAIIGSKELSSIVLKALGFVDFTINHFVENIIIPNKINIAQQISSFEENVDFHNLMADNEANITPTNIQQFKDFPVFVISSLTDNEESCIKAAKDKTIYKTDSVTKTFVEGKFVDVSLLNILSFKYSDNRKYWIDKLNYVSLDLNTLRGNGIRQNYPNAFENMKKRLSSDETLNIAFWNWVRINYDSDEKLKMVSSFKDFPVIVENTDNKPEYAVASSVYLNTQYKDIVKRLKPNAKFVSNIYPYHREGNSWTRLFIAVGLIKNTSELILDLLNSSEFDAVEDVGFPKMIADNKDDLKDHLQDMYGLRLLTKGGKFVPIKDVVLNYSTTAVPYPFITIPNELDITAYSDSALKRFITELGDKAGSKSISTEQSWKCEKIKYYISHQDDFGKEINIKVIRTLAEEFKEDHSNLIVDKDLLDKLRLYSDKREKHLIGELTLGSAYATATMLRSRAMCEFQSHGVESLNYLSSDYIIDANVDLITDYLSANSLKNRIHFLFGDTDIELLSHREFAIYFWKDYLKSEGARSHVKSMIKDGKFQDKPCVPTLNGVKSAEELYSPTLSIYVKNIAIDWENKLPVDSIVDFKNLYEDNNIIMMLDFAKELEFMDCLNAMSMPRLMSDPDTCRQLILFLIEDYKEDDEKYIDRFRESTKILNGRKDLVPIKDLYAVEPYIDSQSFQLFHDNKGVVYSYALPQFGDGKYVEACKILKIGIIGKNDIEFTYKADENGNETSKQLNTLKVQLLIAAAVEDPANWNDHYKNYVGIMSQYTFQKCKNIVLQYKVDHNINANAKKFYVDKNAKKIYYTEDLYSGLVYGDYRDSINDILSLTINKDMLNVILWLSSEDKIKEYVEEHCSSLLDEEEFVNCLNSLKPQINIKAKVNATDISDETGHKQYTYDKKETSEYETEDKSQSETSANNAVDTIEGTSNENEHHLDSKEEVASYIESSWNHASTTELPRRSGSNIPSSSANSYDDFQPKASNSSSDKPIFNRRNYNHHSSSDLMNDTGSSRASSNASRTTTNSQKALDNANDVEKTLELLSDIQKYSYKWFKYLIHLQEVANGTDSGNERIYDVNFMDVTFDEGHVILSKPIPYIPNGIDDTPAIVLDFIMKNGMHYNIESQISGRTEKELILNMSPDEFTSEQWDNFKQCHITVKGIDGNLAALKNGFAQLRLEGDTEIPNEYQMDDNLPKNIDFIYGPPGTGKTHELIVQITDKVNAGKNKEFNILVLTPTNKAADVIAKRLMKDKNIRPLLKRFGTTVDEELATEYDILANRNNLDLADNNINVVVTNTTRYAYDSVNEDGESVLIRDVNWDYVYIDEASMIDIISITYVLYKSRGAEFVISGDPYQIQPVCHPYFQHENIYTMVGLRSFADAINGTYQKYNVDALTTQYRSIPAIGKLVSLYTYDGKVVAERTEESQKPLVLDGLDIKPINIVGFKTEIFDNLYGISSLNNSPVQVYSIIFACRFASFISKQIKMKHSDEECSIGIISPYKAQAESISNMLENMPVVNDKCKITCGTVHSFQGDACDIIIFVMNPPDKITSGAHINNHNILNVAMSRASDYLFILSPQIDDYGLIERDNICSIADQLDSKILKASQIEAAMSDGNANFIEDNTMITGHNPVNVYSDMEEEKLYEVRISDTAIDIKIND